MQIEATIEVQLEGEDRESFDRDGSESIQHWKTIGMLRAVASFASQDWSHPKHCNCVAFLPDGRIVGTDGRAMLVVFGEPRPDLHGPFLVRSWDILSALGKEMQWSDGFRIDADGTLMLDSYYGELEVRSQVRAFFGDYPDIDVVTGATPASGIVSPFLVNPQLLAKMAVIADDIGIGVVLSAGGGETCTRWDFHEDLGAGRIIASVYIMPLRASPDSIAAPPREDS